MTDHTDNKRAYSGGLYIEDSTVAITGGVVSGNSTDCGGGAFLTGCDGATVSGMSFTDNQASSYGGGLYTNGANISLADATITGNATEGYGGGIYAVGLGDVTIDGATTISTNTAAAGGGIAHNAKSVMTVGENCLVANNRCRSISVWILRSMQRKPRMAQALKAPLSCPRTLFLQVKDLLL